MTDDELAAADLARAGVENHRDRTDLSQRGCGNALGPECPSCGRWAGRLHTVSWLECALCGHRWRDPAGKGNYEAGDDLMLALGAEQHGRIRSPYLMPHELPGMGYRRSPRRARGAT